MLRSALVRISGAARMPLIVKNTPRVPAVNCARSMSHGPTETDEEFDARYIAYLSRKDIDGWELRKAINDLIGMDLVPEPKIIIAALHACRRLNDYAVTTRFLEAIKDKSGHSVDTVYPYILQEIKPTMDELGISTPEEMGYDKPELALKTVFE
uniref:Cytochrome c oxidase subunit 5A, mitochondrial n=1 Tax=Hirondellea gigas TaxID=1518452 RepID=A0A6A7FPV0_9CRUS